MRTIADRYELVALVGRGGMGEVWEGRDRVIGRRVAVKLLPDHQHGPAADLFFREARTAGGLNHRGVVTVHDLGRDPRDGTLYLIMEYVAGRDLADVLREDGTPTPATSVEWAAQTAAALAAAHDAGVVHRDLKPANLMLTTGGEVKVLDFGIARFMAATDKSSQVMGTLAYLAPERFAERPGDARSDLYAFGCVLYELLTGQAPFPAGDPVSLMSAHLNRVPQPPSSLRPGLSAALDTLVLRLLAKEPADRPPSAAVVHDELRALRLGPEPEREPEPADATPARSSSAPDPAPATPTAPAGPPPRPHPQPPGTPERPAPAHQLPTQPATPPVPGKPPGAAAGPAARTPAGAPATKGSPAPGRRRALLLGLGGVAAVAVGGTGLALALRDDDRDDGRGSAATGPEADTSPRPKVRPWRHDIENSLPAMCAAAHGVLYVGTASTVIALHARTGEQRWEGPDVIFPPNRPAVADGTVYVAGGDTLWALDAADGRKKWTFPAGDRIHSRPAVVGGVVYFAGWGQQVYAARADGGRKVWSSPTGGKVWCSPTVKDGTVYVGCGEPGNTLYALDAASGARKWAFDADDGFFEAPVVSGGVVYAPSGGTIHAIHADQGTRKWSVPGTASTQQTLRLAGDTLYVAGDDGRVHALDPSTGARKWTHELLMTVDPTQLAVAGDLVYFGETLSAVGTVRALATADGSERWSCATGARMGSGNRTNGLVAAYGFVYVTNEDGLVALDAATGAMPA